MAGANRSHGYKAGCIERCDHHMLRRAGRSPAAWQPDGEDHRGRKCVEKPETAPYPKGNGRAGAGNQKFDSSGMMYSHAEKANRADGEGFLDPVAIEPGTGNGEFGGRIGDGSEDQQKRPVVCRRG